MAAPSSRSAPEERLVNLLVALMATEQGLTKDTILSSVAGYREQAESGASKDALEKMFERDKESLRGLGVPIETIGDHADPDDLREARYRVPNDDYALPEDISFSPGELAVLALAGEVWSESSLSAEARSGLRKIRALGNDVDEPILGFSPRLNVRTPAFAPLQKAIEQARVASFPYLKPGEDRPRTRRIRPLALVDFEGRWHVYGIDVAQDAARTFLLSRIVGDVAVTRESFDPVLRDHAGERAVAGLEEVAAQQHALLEVNPGTEASLRLRRRAEEADQGILVPYVDVHVFADELASYGPEVRVVEPAQLRDEVIRRLEATLALHADPGGADEGDVR
ncbi:WYL domain-containing protein [Microbacterium sp. zg.Y1090]|uniref:helix-turn-helix transcriptional regulator n=1 Tax=Microbacterium TaxID=33882 RepID=UPI00214AA6CB|nr:MULTISPECIES: WYL domain-containing protein [unclassified Microbacterium]MCR2811961.1 WYL domain-containing protein [Microbacterium sp. zg.Y1084]MCR2818600.1 WYL domain-containing protein [Microbacterium sp. zg.Y1090]MDL5486414.1 WYL domain-containing protein [Microbacterium sp. zg-Y1211]WIM29603.1 WYL domain-containing protein [Microbacterium sp. zg-Y1090]